MSRLQVEAYRGITRIQDPRLELVLAQNVRFNTFYPGGIYGTGSLSIPRDVAEWWAIKGADRIVLRYGLEVAFEGWIDNIMSAVAVSGQSVRLTITGGWGTKMMRRLWHKPWADSRIDEATWPLMTISAVDKMTLDRRERIMIVPKNVAWTNGQYVRIRYTPPTGELVKRVTYDYDLQEGAQAWELGLASSAFGVLANVTASGTGSVNHTLATPDTFIYLYFIARANQTPASDGSIYAKFTNLVVYTETGAIDLTEIAKDVRAKITDLNATEIYIGSNTYSLVPFYTQRPESAADILTRAAGYGDSSQNPWACYLDHSEKAPAPDGKPVLVVEAKPTLSDYDYWCRVEEIEDGVSFDQYFDDIWNWIIVEYEDKSTRTRKWITPDDDANLANQASIDEYGQRDYPLRVDTTDSTTATNAGRRFLAEHKDPKYRASGPVRLKHQVHTKANTVISAALARAGKRLRIVNFLNDLSIQAGSGLTMLITNTDYDGDSDIVGLSGGDGGVLI
jgi:hypothetical protein